jgi:hypothetical protein
MSVEDALASIVVSILGREDVRAALREALGSAHDDRWISVASAAKELGITPRVILGDARRGRIELGGAGRRRMVRRSELDRWLTSRRPAPADDRTDVRRAVEHAAARVRKG